MEVFAAVTLGAAIVGVIVWAVTYKSDYRQDLERLAALKKMVYEAEARIALGQGSDREAAVRARTAALCEIADLELEIRRYETSVSAARRSW